MAPSLHCSTSEPRDVSQQQQQQQQQQWRTTAGFLLLTRLVVECESQQQFGLINGPHQRFWFPYTRHFHLLLLVFGFFFYCLFVYGVQAFCACSVSSSPFLVNVKRHLQAWKMNYSVFSGSVWTQIFLKRCRGRRREKRSFSSVWTEPKAAGSVWSCELHQVSFLSAATKHWRNVSQWLVHRLSDTLSKLVDLSESGWKHLGSNK